MKITKSINPIVLRTLSITFLSLIALKGWGQSPYCTSTSTSSSSYFSAFITTGAVTNITNNVQSPAYSVNGYGDFTAQSASQAPGGNVNFSTTLVGTTVGVNVWVDWNGNGDFTDVGEDVYHTYSYVSTSSGSFTVPATATVGTTRMRIRMDYNNTNPAICGSIARGETEDYTFIVLPPPPMAYSSCTTTQLNTSPILIGGATAKEIIGIQIVTTGGSSPLSVTSFTLKSNGSTNINDINATNSAKIYYTGTSSTFATTTYFGQNTPTIVNFNITGSQILVTGTNYFWLVYDVKDAATVNNVIDGECTSLTVTSARTPTVTAPAGTRLLTNVLNMTSGTNSYTINSATFYDNGGSGAFYSNAFTGTTTFYPATPCNNIRINFSAYDSEASWDKITIYNGNNTSAPILLNGFSGAAIPTGNPFTSTAPDGSLTVKFVSDATTNKAGWTAAVSSVSTGAPNMAYTSSTTTQSSTFEVYPSNQNQQIIRVEVVTTGACSPINCTQLIMNMTGTTSITDVTNIDVYYTSTPFFSSSNLFGSAAPSSSPITITPSVSPIILAAGSNYFWIVYDIASGATANNYVDAQCTSITVGGTPYAPTVTNPSGSRQIKPNASTLAKKITTSGWDRSVVYDAADASLVWAGNTSEAFGAGGADFYVVKTDLSGTLIWTKTIGGTGDDDGYDIALSADGGYVICGNTNSASLIASGSYDLMVSKLDASGNHVWTRVIGTASNEHYRSSIIKTADNGFAITGRTDANSGEMFFCKLDASGNVMARREIDPCIASCTGNSGEALLQSTDGGYVIVGGTINNGMYYVIKLKSDYSTDWSMYWGADDSKEESLYAVVENAANDYTVFGTTSAQGAGGGDFYAMRFTISGTTPTVVWASAYGTTNPERFYDATPSGDGGYVLSGHISNAIQDGYLMKIDIDGNLAWKTKVPNVGSNRQYNGIIKIPSGGYAIAALGSFEIHRVGEDGSECGSTASSGIRTSLAAPIISSLATNNDELGWTDASKAPTLGTGNGATDICTSVVLPIELLYFNGYNKDEINTLEWSTASELNNDYFTIERSSDAVNFESVGKNNGAGNSTTTQNYSMIDFHPYSPITYYRLTQTDIDGQSETSNIISIQRITGISSINYTVFPNPTLNNFSVLANTVFPMESIIEIRNYLGQTVLEKPVTSSTNELTVSLDNEFAKGLYIIILKHNNEILYTNRIIKQ